MALEQALGDELGAAALQGQGLVQAAGLQGLPVQPPLAGQGRGVEGQGGKQQPRVVVDVGLDQPVAVADADGHHGEDGDPVGGQVAGGERRGMEVNEEVCCDYVAAGR